MRFVELFTGTRIEGFNIKAILFSNREKAIEYAKNLVETHREVSGYESIDAKHSCLSKYRDDSEYYYMSEGSAGGYEDFPDLEVAVTKEILDLDAGMTIEFRA